MAVSHNRGDLWMRRLHAAEEGTPRLVCFPHAGGSASYFHPLSASLAPKIDVLVAQYPGRQDRRAEPPIDNIPELADTILARAGAWFEGAPALYGHSMGAMLAFEIARRLERDRGMSPAALVVSGQRAPSVPREGHVHLLDDDGIVAQMRVLGGTDTSLLADRELRELILPAVRSDYKAIKSYQYESGPPLRCPVVVMTGDADPMVSPEEADPWREHTEARCSYHRFQGGHFFIAEHPAEVTSIIADAVVANSG